MYEIKIKLIQTSFSSNSNGFGGSEKKDVINLNPILTIYNIENMSIKIFKGESKSNITLL
jgi:hypothetical protein